MYRYSKEIICTLIMCMIIASSAYSKMVHVDSLGLPGDNFDLYGALELFKKSNSPEEFEKSLNSENNGINNLDLNGDHQTDYIRVVDHSQDNSHSIVMQDVLSGTEVQDIAVIGMEKNNDQVTLQIIGDEALYGKNYIIEPSDLSANGQTNSGQQMPQNNYNSNNNGNYNNGNYNNNYNNNGNYNSSSYNNNNYNNNGNYNDNYNNGNYNNSNYNYDYNSNNYNNNSYYYNPPPAVNVIGWPMVQYVYGPQYTVWVSPWRWNAYPGWWRPWRTVGLPVYYGRVNVYHNNYYYRPVNVPRVINAHQAYYPNRSYSTVIHNTYINSPSHYGPRPNMQNQGAFHQNQGSFHQNQGGFQNNNYGGGRGQRMGGNGGGMRGNGGGGGGGGRGRR
jgi:hypothetical protein